jgi:hypothetical protein
MHLFLSSWNAFAVIATIFGCFSSGRSLLMAAVASRPVTSGIITSMLKKHGRINLRGETEERERKTEREKREREKREKRQR